MHKGSCRVARDSIIEVNTLVESLPPPVLLQKDRWPLIGFFCERLPLHGPPIRRCHCSFLIFARACRSPASHRSARADRVRVGQALPSLRLDDELSGTLGSCSPRAISYESD